MCPVGLTGWATSTLHSYYEGCECVGREYLGGDWGRWGVGGGGGGLMADGIREYRERASRRIGPFTVYSD